jgi:hypothetical protein
MKITIIIGGGHPQIFDLDGALDHLQTLKDKQSSNENEKCLKEYFTKYPFMIEIPLGAKGTYYKNEPVGETYKLDASYFVRGYKYDKNNRYYFEFDEEHPEYSEEAVMDAIDNLPYYDIDVDLPYYPKKGGSIIIGYRSANLKDGWYVDSVEAYYDPE